MYRFNYVLCLVILLGFGCNKEVLNEDVGNEENLNMIAIPPYDNCNYNAWPIRVHKVIIKRTESNQVFFDQASEIKIDQALVRMYNDFQAKGIYFDLVGPLDVVELDYEDIDDWCNINPKPLNFLYNSAPEMNFDDNAINIYFLPEIFKIPRENSGTPGNDFRIGGVASGIPGTNITAWAASACGSSLPPVGYTPNTIKGISLFIAGKHENGNSVYDTQVLSHEMGHCLGLVHESDEWNIMFPGNYSLSASRTFNFNQKFIMSSLIFNGKHPIGTTPIVNVWCNHEQS